MEELYLKIYLSCCCCWYWASSWFICKGSSGVVILVSSTGGGESGEASLGEGGLGIGVVEGDVFTNVAGVEWESLAARNSPFDRYSAKFWVNSDMACVKRSAVGRPSGWVET